LDDTAKNEQGSTGRKAEPAKLINTNSIGEGQKNHGVPLRFGRL
jgi:hypothetical protein